MPFDPELPSQDDSRAELQKKETANKLNALQQKTVNSVLEQIWSGPKPLRGFVGQERITDLLRLFSLTRLGPLLPSMHIHAQEGMEERPQRGSRTRLLQLIVADTYCPLEFVSRNNGPWTRVDVDSVTIVERQPGLDAGPAALDERTPRSSPTNPPDSPYRGSPANPPRGSEMPDDDAARKKREADRRGN